MHWTSNPWLIIYAVAEKINYLSFLSFFYRTLTKLDHPIAVLTSRFWIDMKQVWPSSLGINLSQLEQLLLQLCRIQVLLLGELAQDELELGGLALLHEHVGVTYGGASVQQPPHHALHKDKNYKRRLQFKLKYTLCIAGLRIRFRIESGFSRVGGSGSGSRKAKMTNKRRKKLRN